MTSSGEWQGRARHSAGGRPGDARIREGDGWGTGAIAAWVHSVSLPDSVGPGQRRAASEIASRIASTLARGGWTKAENAALNRMLRQWRERAAGRSLWFNLHGWRRSGGSTAAGMRTTAWKREMGAALVE